MLHDSIMYLSMMFKSLFAGNKNHSYCFDSLKSFKPVRLPFSLCSVMLKCVLLKLKRRYNNFRDVSLNHNIIIGLITENIFSLLRHCNHSTV